MEKVQDINEKGTAYTVLGAFRGGYSLGLLPKVLHEGLLGTSFMQGPWRKQWAEKTRERKKVTTYFNIAGRSRIFKKIEGATEDQELKKSYWWLKDSIAVLFDLSSFQEEPPHESESGG